MRISGRTLTAAIAGALTVGGTFAACPPAGATAPRSPHGTKSAAMALVTTITEVENVTDRPVTVWSKEANSWFSTTPIAAHSTITGSMRVPWVGNQDEMNKAIQIYKIGVTNSGSEQSFFLYDLFQDYHQPNNQVMYGFYNSYDLPRPQPVPGDSTGGGNKRLVIAPDRPYMRVS
ncbi:hypothetical protein [Actinoallomurus rhizosphaericola]|uniref:hypothetical protein n=1 Tax=Actinoallomurus rhizosphaericola TaxID=2952536 RepID=UPI0020926EFF|nr:hypothetical protein [Actinoallomurus rhizosphaericola]MCO5999668.1 hypothetical protein [Actinoallomurus rhizosphaericola]